MTASERLDAVAAMLPRLKKEAYELDQLEKRGLLSFELHEAKEAELAVVELFDNPKPYSNFDPHSNEAVLQGLIECGHKDAAGGWARNLLSNIEAYWKEPPKDRTIDDEATVYATERVAKKYLTELEAAPQQEKSAPAKRKTARKRKSVPDRLKKELQKEIESKCPFCGSCEIATFEFHHINGNPANTVFENLIMLCPTCHAKIEKGSIPDADVHEKKNSLKKGGV